MNYNLELTDAELSSLEEQLSELSKFICREYESMHPGQMHLEPVQDPLFISLCKNRLKIAKARNPNSTIQLKDFLDLGNFGRSS